MEGDNESPSRLTEFGPLETEEKSQGVTQMLTKFFRMSMSLISDDSSISTTETVTRDIDHDSESSTKTETSSSALPIDVNEGRSLSNVLRRISNLRALKSNSLQDYADTELKQYWMPDSVSKECYECSEKFTTFRRRHHCRVCGQIFCSSCCNHQIPGKIFGCTGDLRVCTYCCKVVLQYLQQSEDSVDLAGDLKLLQENLQNKFATALSPSASLQDNNVSSLANDSLSVGSIIKRKISVGYQEERLTGGSANYLTFEEKCRALQNSASLRNLFQEICKPDNGVRLGTHWYRLRTYTDCFLGSELVDWLICQQKASSRVQAAAICQALLEGGYIECVCEPCSFVDGYALYKFGVIFTTETVQMRSGFDVPTQDEPLWVQEIPQDESSIPDSDNEHMTSFNQCMSLGCLSTSASYMLDLDLAANTVYLSRPVPPPFEIISPIATRESHREYEEQAVIRTSEQRELVPESGWHNPSKLRQDNDEKMVYELLSEAYEQHEQSLLKQLLSSKGLSLSWLDVLLPLTHEIVSVVRPNKNHNAEDLDVRHYVQFKKLPGGAKTDTQLIGGIVCTKNVAHRGMATDIQNPKILLLQTSIVYQRTEGRFMSLEPVLMQEHEYLRHVAARIAAFQPNIVLVHRNVSRLAQDLLREQGITLVHNVKLSVLERLSRCTEADLITSVDAHIGRPKLGSCKRFHLKNFETEMGGRKTLMFFEGLPQPHLGGTVLLKGASKQELAQIAEIASFMTFVAYNWRLEKSFLMDEFAKPPNSKCEFLDESKESSPTAPPATKITVVDKKKTSTNEPATEPVKDFTDPLHSYWGDDDEEGDARLKEKLSVAELPFSNSFRKALDDTIFCISPYLKFSVPYLETEAGKKCSVRQFFPTEIYFSKQFNNDCQDAKPSRDSVDLGGQDRAAQSTRKVKPLHPFLTTPIVSSIDSNETQGMLALFRACGGQYEKRDILIGAPNEGNEADEIRKKLNHERDKDKPDVLDPGNHQRLAVLFCSYSAESNNAPAFCVNPWVVPMDFYIRNDIPLGFFLEKYCFRSSYECPSKTCETPMSRHVRRFVHGVGCVSISLNSFQNGFGEEDIVMWSWCTKCQSVSPVVPMSADTWAYSFAKYLQLRFHGAVYRRRGSASCTHSLHHDHCQYFGYKNYVASFKYSSVHIWEIALPPFIIGINYNNERNKNQNELIDDVRQMAQIGHEIFSLILERLSCLPAEIEGLGNLKQLLLKEQALFKQKIEEIQLKLTSPTVETRSFQESGGSNWAYWKITDSIVRIKRMIVETVEVWNLRLSEAARKRDGDRKRDKASSSVSELDSPTSSENRSLLEGASIESSNNDPEIGNAASSFLVNKKIRSFDQEEVSGYDQQFKPSSPKCHQRSQSDGTAISHNDSDSVDSRKESDKKTVKNILQQLLPSNPVLTSIPMPFSSQEHHTLPVGVSMPIVVYENEPSSIVAYALNSFDYKKYLEDSNGKRSVGSEQSPSPIQKRKSLERPSLETESQARSTRRESNGSGLQAALLELSQPFDHNTTATDKSDDVKKKNHHIDIQFEDATCNCNFFCKIYFAEKFAALRAVVLPTGEESYVRSLTRSVPWNARGGKSGSNFAKTLDDRFILKDTTKSEMTLILESAQDYFQYMHKCYKTNQPTLLGKIVGIYQITFKNLNTNGQLRTHLLVMENLFYNRTVIQKFDLKGSMRNRLVIPDNQEGENVLLDENLLKMSCDSPLYILPHSKAVLTAAIQNDTEFLAALTVMDYSLLVGLDMERNELVLGIIDYIRRFTWDKKLETYAKKSGILGGQGKLPTIIPPKEYQKRFIEAMHRYFLEVPDHWAGLGRGLEF